MRAVCGLDVHKDSVFLCIFSENGEKIEKVFRKKLPISMSMLMEVLKTRMPSLSGDALGEYDRLRQQFEHQSVGKGRKKVGFILN